MQSAERLQRSTSHDDATRSSLVRRLPNWGDDHSWQQFFDTYWKLIYAVAIKSGLSDVEAQDVVQETVLSVAKTMRANGYDRQKSAFKTFLYNITRRRIIDHFRKRTPAGRRLILDDQSANEMDFPQPAVSVELDEIWSIEWEKNLLDAAVERVRGMVTPKQFQIFDLSVLREMPVSEVRKLLKVNPAQVYLARHRVGALLRKEVEKLRGADEIQTSQK